MTAQKDRYYVLAIILLLGFAASFLLLKRKNDAERAYASVLENRINALSVDSSNVQEERWLSSLSLRENGLAVKKDITLMDNDVKTSFTAYTDTISEPS